MKYSTSLYLGGEIISASELTSDQDPYSYTRRYGLVCPCCKESVFWKRDFMRNQGHVPACFAHYHNDDPLLRECELRSQRIDNPGYRSQLDSEAKKQRLKLFNKYLWDIVQSDEDVKHFAKGLSNDSIKELSSYCLSPVMQELKGNIDFWQTDMENIFLHSQRETLLNNESQKLFTARCVTASIKKASGLDRKIQIMVAQEIIQFLSTRTGGYALEKLIKVSLIVIAKSKSLFSLKRDIPFHQAISLSLPVLRNIVRNDIPFLVRTIATIILRVDWVNVFREKSELF